MCEKVTRLSLVPRRSPPAQSTRLGAKCRDVTEWGLCGAIRWRQEISRQVVWARRERLGTRLHQTMWAVFHSLAIALEEMAKLFSNLITLALLLMLLVGVNAGGGDKDQKNESEKKTEVELDLAVCWHFLITFYIPHCICAFGEKNTANQYKWKYNKLHFQLLGNRQLSFLCLLWMWQEFCVSLATFTLGYHLSYHTSFQKRA